MTPSKISHYSTAYEKKLFIHHIKYPFPPSFHYCSWIKINSSIYAIYECGTYLCLFNIKQHKMSLFLMHERNNSMTIFWIFPTWVSTATCHHTKCLFFIFIIFIHDSLTQNYPLFFPVPYTYIYVYIFHFTFILINVMSPIFMRI